jgi:hypothetical protein
MAITKIYKHGIEITKPWSTEMYEFNDQIKEQYKEKITSLIQSLESEDQCQTIARIINPYGYGIGFDLTDMKEDMINNLKNAESYWYKEIITDFISEGYIDPIYINDEQVNLIGFESREEILHLREIFSA